MEDWDECKRLPEEKPSFSLIRWLLLGANSVVYKTRLKAIETNEITMAKISESKRFFVGRNASVLQYTQFVGRNAAVLQYTHFVYVNESTRRRMSIVATPKPERFEEEWAK